MLMLCWDASLRLDEHVSPPRVRIAHAVEAEDSRRQSASAAFVAERRVDQKALMPVSARPTVSWCTVSVPS